MKATRGVFGGWEAGGGCMQNSVCCVPSVPRMISLDWTMIAVFRVRRAACITGDTGWCAPVRSVRLSLV